MVPWETWHPGTAPARKIPDGKGVLCVGTKWEGRACVKESLFPGWSLRKNTGRLSRLEWIPGAPRIACLPEDSDPEGRGVLAEIL